MIHISEECLFHWLSEKIFMRIFIKKVLRFSKKTLFLKSYKKIHKKFYECTTFTIRNVSPYVCSLRNVSDATLVSKLVKILSGNTIILFKAVINSIAYKLEGLYCQSSLIIYWGSDWQWQTLKLEQYRIDCDIKKFMLQTPVFFIKFICIHLLFTQCIRCNSSIKFSVNP